MYRNYKQKRRRLAIAAAAGTVAILATACSSSSSNSSNASGTSAGGAGSVIKIGVSVSLSGDDADTGKLVETGYQFWQKTINAQGGIQVGNVKHKVQLIIQDDGSSPTTAATITEKLITQDHVNFMFGPYGTTNSIAVAQIAHRDNTVVLFPSASGNALYAQGYTNIFAVLPRASTIPGFWLDSMIQADPGLKTLGIITNDQTQPESERAGLLAEAQKKGIKVVYDKSYPATQTDFSTLVTQMKSANPQVVAQLGYTPDAAAILSAMQSQDWYPEGMVYTGVATAQFQTLTKGAADYSYVPVYWYPTLPWSGPLFGTAADYNKAFTEAYGVAPTSEEALASGAGEILQEAIADAGSLSSSAVQNVLHTDTFNTEGGGKVKYSATGYNENAVTLIEQIQPSGIVLTYAPGMQLSTKPIFPAPGWNAR